MVPDLFSEPTGLCLLPHDVLVVLSTAGTNGSSGPSKARPRAAAALDYHTGRALLINHTKLDLYNLVVCLDTLDDACHLFVLPLSYKDADCNTKTSLVKC